LQFGFISLGCPKNQVDTEIMMGAVSEHGTITPEIKAADVVVINTCGFINAAKEEAINTILDTAEQLSSEQLLLVTGCLAQRYAEDLLREMPEIDGIMGVGNPQQVTELIDRALAGERPKLVAGQPSMFREEGPRILSTPNGWAYLKIAEGCHNRCSYCAIPSIRGGLRCREPQSILVEAQHLVEQGCRELVLVAQDTTVYHHGEHNLSTLLMALNQIEGLEWIRVMYAHPSHLNEPTIEALANCSKVVPYLDLPVQHGNDQVLQRMNRNYSQGQLLDTIERLRQAIPDIALRTTIMVGFPGESEAEFRTLKEFVTTARFNWLGAFTYCQEEGTLSATMLDDVPAQVKQERQREIEELQQGITVSWLKGMLGTTQPVLLEAPWRNGMRGRAAFAAPEIDGKVLIPNAESAQYGSIVQVRLKRIRGVDLIGEIES